MKRGAEFYDLVMAMRFDREAARMGGAWSLLCKIASEFRRMDERDRAGRVSWEPVSTIRLRWVRLLAQIVGVNIAGLPRPTRSHPTPPPKETLP